MKNRLNKNVQLGGFYYLIFYTFYVLYDKTFWKQKVIKYSRNKKSTWMTIREHVFLCKSLNIVLNF